MIVGEIAEFFPVYHFAQQLMQATKGVVLVSQHDSRPIAGQSLSSGWLITPDLVVIPRYVTQSNAAQQSTIFQCKQYNPRLYTYDAVDAEVLDTNALGKTPKQSSSISSPSRLELQKPILLRLKQPLPESHPLSLELADPVVNQRVIVLQHPKGVLDVQLSMGRMITLQSPWIHHSADTEHGSSGSPIFTQNWKVMAMHVGRAGANDPLVNEGLCMAYLIEHLRSTDVWDEIAKHHSLAALPASDIRQTQVKVDTSESFDGFLRLVAATRWDFRAEVLAPSARRALSLKVLNPKSDRWTVRTPERTKSIRAARTLDKLREARQSTLLSDDSTDPRQKVIDAILAGGPFDLAAIPEDDLPHWLQAVRWFADVVPNLPSAALIAKTLERRRIRSNLRNMASDDFQGRKSELGQLNTWYASTAPGPMVVSGIGGIGKSALISQFALSLPAETILLWLDFDRADIKSDDAASIVNALIQQSAAQIENFNVPLVDNDPSQPSQEDQWQQFAVTWAEKLAEHGPSKVLLVLDSFEIAQHVKRYAEIWTLLESVVPKLPELRVVVSGRAEVTGLSLAGRPSVSLHLQGMDRADAELWLRQRWEHGTTIFSHWFTQAANSDDISRQQQAESTLQQVLDICFGIPLRLNLATRWLETGGNVQEIPKELPQALVEGFLYQRILDRVVDQELLPVARAALVLRRVSVDMVEEVLGPIMPAQLEPQETFWRLAREMAIVDTDGLKHPAEPADENSAQPALRVRPEVRLATLRLLEIDDKTAVLALDERAVAWYGRQDLSKTNHAAELIYHLLRLGRVEQADQVWQTNADCLTLLLYAVDEIPETQLAARRWLQQKLKGTSSSNAEQKSWERDALVRAQDAMSRHMNRSLHGILNENAQRSDDSPLIFFDAWMLWQSERREEARKLLQSHESHFNRDRNVLAAHLAAEDGDLQACDRLLQTVDDRKHWLDIEQSRLIALAIKAARIRLAVDLNAESQLLDLLAQTDSLDVDSLEPGCIHTTDVLLPPLARKVGSSILEAIQSVIEIPATEYQLAEFAKRLDDARVGAALRLSEPGSSDLPPRESTSENDNAKPEDRVRMLAKQLGQLGGHRWRLVTSSLFLHHAIEEMQPNQSPSPLLQSVLATLALFTSRETWSFQLPIPDWFMTTQLTQLLTVNFESQIAKMLEGNNRQMVSNLLKYMLPNMSLNTRDNLQMLPNALVRTRSMPFSSIFFYLISEDPLAELVKVLAANPSNSQ